REPSRSRTRSKTLRSDTPALISSTLQRVKTVSATEGSTSTRRDSRVFRLMNGAASESRCRAFFAHSLSEKPIFSVSRTTSLLIGGLQEIACETAPVRPRVFEDLLAPGTGGLILKPRPGAEQQFQRCLRRGIDFRPVLFEQVEEMHACGVPGVDEDDDRARLQADVEHRRSRNVGLLEKEFDVGADVLDRDLLCLRLRDSSRNEFGLKLLRPLGDRQL